MLYQVQAIGTLQGSEAAKQISRTVTVHMLPNALANEEAIKFWVRNAYGKDLAQRRLLVWDSLTAHRVVEVNRCSRMSSVVSMQLFLEVASADKLTNNCPHKRLVPIFIISVSR